MTMWLCEHHKYRVSKTRSDWHVGGGAIGVVQAQIVCRDWGCPTANRLNMRPRQ
jgi:hypothetical protein